MYKIFSTIDIDKSGSISLFELMVYLDVAGTVFSDRIFGIFDADNSGTIDFREFVIALWNYCTLEFPTLVIFAFDLYDKDASGFLSTTEIKQMLGDIYGKHAATNSYAKTILSELKHYDESAEFNLEKFRLFVKHHGSFLFPAFQMQEALQKKILGKSYWSKQSNRRVEISKGKYVPITQLMLLHTNKSLQDEYLKDKSNDDSIKENTLRLLKTSGTLHNRNHISQTNKNNDNESDTDEEDYSDSYRRKRTSNKENSSRRKVTNNKSESTVANSSQDTNIHNNNSFYNKPPLGKPTPYVVPEFTNNSFDLDNNSPDKNRSNLPRVLSANNSNRRRKSTSVVPINTENMIRTTGNNQSSETSNTNYRSNNRRRTFHSIDELKHAMKSSLATNHDNNSEENQNGNNENQNKRKANRRTSINLGSDEGHGNSANATAGDWNELARYETKQKNQQLQRPKSEQKMRNPKNRTTEVSQSVDVSEALRNKQKIAEDYSNMISLTLAQVRANEQENQSDKKIISPNKRKQKQRKEQTLEIKGENSYKSKYKRNDLYVDTGVDENGYSKKRSNSVVEVRSKLPSGNEIQKILNELKLYQ
eukprot:gene7378-10050_t